MLIPCPCCGPRDAREFHYGGDAGAVRPSLDVNDVEAWHGYLHLRQNPRGPHVELWHPVDGCRSWLRVRRDTLTHEVQGAELLGRWGPAA